MLIIPIIYFYFHGHQILKVASISFFYNFCFSPPRVLQTCYHCYHLSTETTMNRAFCGWWQHLFFCVKKLCCHHFFLFFLSVGYFPPVFPVLTVVAADRYNLPHSSVWRCIRTRSFNRFREVETLVPPGCNCVFVRMKPGFWRAATGFPSVCSRCFVLQQPCLFRFVSFPFSWCIFLLQRPFWGKKVSKVVAAALFSA